MNLNTGECSDGTIQTTWQYDDEGRTTRTTDPLGHAIDIAYDVDGPGELGHGPGDRTSPAHPFRPIKIARNQ